MIYFTLFIPIIITFMFYLWKKHEFIWWEFFIPILVTIGIILITKVIFDSSSTTYKEYWGSSIIEVYEAEPWNEWIVETCETCYSDDEGNETCTYYDCSYQDDHGPKWYATTNIGEHISIDESIYDKILIEWGGLRVKTKTITNDFARSSAVYSNNTKFAGKNVGPESYIWRVDWNNQDATRFPYVSTHKYENRIKSSDLSLFNINLVTEEIADSLNLIEYPIETSGINVPTILGVPVSESIQKKYKQLNAKFGPTNELRLWILVYKDAPSTTFDYQKNYWVSGNKNELVIAMSLDKNNKVQWVNSFSWALSEQLTVESKNVARNIGKFDKAGWDEYADWLNKNLNRFERRDFEEFSYIKVESSKASIITIIIFSIIFSIGLNIYVINNDIK